jgi:hypothetical protein
MPILSSGLVLIETMNGFNVYSPGAGPQLGAIAPLKDGSTWWTACNHRVCGGGLTDSLGRERRFRSRDAAAEALAKEVAKPAGRR